ncbi:HNH endonuclease [Bradyrhizobium sp. CCGUVB23]|uniref:HNH endonuclease n=1 Tax=Bradyrhizobium sp. CCGUVB23 TaxID=2949630 RepID=UPI003531B7B0
MRGRLDHINRDRLDNRLENLRECSASENRMNSSVRSDCISGLKAASFDRRTGRYKAVIRMTGRGGRRKYLGTYKTAEEAHRAFCKASQERSSAFFSEATKPEA